MASALSPLRRRLLDFATELVRDFGAVDVERLVPAARRSDPALEAVRAGDEAQKVIGVLGAGRRVRFVVRKRGRCHEQQREEEGSALVATGDSLRHPASGASHGLRK